MRGLPFLLMLLWAALIAAPAAAGPAAITHSCAAPSSIGEPLATLASDTLRWRCGGGRPSLAPERTVLRYEIEAGTPLPDHFATRAHALSALTLAIVRDGAIVAETSTRAEQIRIGGHGDAIRLPLPGIVRDGDSVLVAFDRPTTPGLFMRSALVRQGDAWGLEELQALLIAALVGGLLLMPLAFNAAYYRVLRERFMLWHLVLSATLLVQCFLNSGIFGLFFAISLPLHAAIGTLSFGFGVAAAAAFGATFIEPRKLDPRLRRWLMRAAAAICVATVLHVAFPMVLRAWQTTAYYLVFAPALLLFSAVLYDAHKRQSRAVRYQMVAWSPFILMGAIRIVTMAVPNLPPSDAMGLFFAAMVVQGVATSMGVADRLVSIKRQRDRALTRARSLELLSERDDLTGLYNRRALDGALGDFVKQGFTGFALFDLDHFKRVNDTHGHAVGDAVIRVTANVLGGHEDSVAVRLGGEEFLLLLRGPAVAERVERLREALPVRIAREVHELQSLVTASAGLVEGAETIGNDFVGLYQMADELLYEAKHNGRNLMAAVMLPRDEMPRAAAFAAA
ncbi:sensor domain-containing diguanylate cyclase [Qipengyuania sediminis]|uniref:GGDEF domain-containing protein n=1 Tax=Qipengyuania sediminis TaxID=1532023 RepID=UPI001059A0FD|nr:diguanylate cyclase [Qipengyuania sediminis]